MRSRVDLVLTGPSRFEWPLGRIVEAPASPAGFGELVERHAADTEASALLFWHPRLGRPDVEVIEQTLLMPGDLWHGGLRLGTSGLPGLMDFVNPLWTQHRDPPADIVAQSWRLSLDACLVRTGVVRALGSIADGFESLDAAGLELGLRYFRRGVLTRHVPGLVPDSAEPIGALSFHDELLFNYLGYDSKWVSWYLMRAVATGYVSPVVAAAAWQRVRRVSKRKERRIYAHQVPDGPMPRARVSVVVPTLDRYPYVRKVLSQLRTQTLPPHQILVVDQSEVFDPTLADDFRDLPLVHEYQEVPGQCTSRNRALAQATGDHILFIDDDDEIPDDLIERLTRTMHALGADVCSGRTDEIGVPVVPEEERFIRLSDKFPTNNTLVRREVLEKSGLFDLAYDRRPRADGDLGMRVYLSGALIVSDATVGVLHHRAPAGGLRRHGVRVQTSASRKQVVRHRHLPNPSEIYLGRRYFTARQVRESLWLRAASTLAARGPLWKRVAKSAYGMALLPDTVREIAGRVQVAGELMDQFPKIPNFPSG